MTIVCQREHSYPIKYPILAISLCRFLAWLLYSITVSALLKIILKKNSVVPTCTLASAEDLEPGLELVTFSAIRATFPLLHFPSSYLLAKSFLLMGSPQDLTECCHKVPSQGSGSFPRGQKLYQWWAWHTDVLREPPRRAGRKFLSLWWTLSGATCDRAP